MSPSWPRWYKRLRIMMGFFISSLNSFYTLFDDFKVPLKVVVQ
jgi:hypothetical protein